MYNHLRIQYIDHYYNMYTTKNNTKGKQNPTLTSKLPRPDSLPRDSEDHPTSPRCGQASDMLHSINNKLSGLDARYSHVEALQREFQAIRESLQFSQEQVASLTKENKALHHSVSKLTTQPSSFVKENKQVKETTLDLQARSMLLDSNPKHTSEDPQNKDFIINKLTVPVGTTMNITFH